TLYVKLYHKRRRVSNPDFIDPRRGYRTRYAHLLEFLRSPCKSMSRIDLHERLEPLDPFPCWQQRCETRNQAAVAQFLPGLAETLRGDQTGRAWRRERRHKDRS